MNERAKESVRSLYRTTVRTRLRGQCGNILRRIVGKRLRFQITPEIFYRIEFRSIRRKPEDMEPRRLLQKALHDLAMMRPKVVPDQDDVAGDMAHQKTQEGANRNGIEIGIRMQSEVQPNSITFGRNTERGDHRNFLMGSRSLLKNGRLTDGGPRPADQGRHQHATFVYENKKSVQVVGFFLHRGHFSFTHLRMATSFRSMARRAGRCGLHPIRRNKRPI